jgi:hypothetical protein
MRRGPPQTPKRRDGHRPIVTMQCGPVHHHTIEPDLTRLAMLEQHPLTCVDREQSRSAWGGRVTGGRGRQGRRRGHEV